MATDRPPQERRRRERRKPPSASIDVTRLEHENLYGQVAAMLRTIARIETELHEQRERIGALERDVAAIILQQSRGA